MQQMYGCWLKIICICYKQANFIDSFAFFLVWKNVVLSLVVVQFKVSETPHSLCTGTLTSLPQSVAKAKN